MPSMPAGQDPRSAVRTAPAASLGPARWPTGFRQWSCRPRRPLREAKPLQLQCRPPTTTGPQRGSRLPRRGGRTPTSSNTPHVLIGPTSAWTPARPFGRFVNRRCRPPFGGAGHGRAMMPWPAGRAPRRHRPERPSARQTGQQIGNYRMFPASCSMLVLPRRAPPGVPPLARGGMRACATTGGPCTGRITPVRPLPPGVPYSVPGSPQRDPRCSPPVRAAARTPQPAPGRGPPDHRAPSPRTTRRSGPHGHPAPKASSAASPSPPHRPRSRSAADAPSGP